MINSESTIIISRTDAIGDVVLTLPMAGWLKEKYPQSKILFFGKTYTRAVIECSTAVDGFINYDDFEKRSEKERALFLKEYNADVIIHVYPRKSIAEAAKSARIKMRIGTTNRVFHWLTCNTPVRLSRRNSDMHESVLNFRLLKPLGYKDEISTDEISAYYKFKKPEHVGEEFTSMLAKDKINLILHPKSHGSAREWRLEHFEELISLLPEKYFKIFITGGEKETDSLSYWSKDLPASVTNLSGKLTLPQLLDFIQNADGVIAASTGPLHIAAAMGKFALGIYPPIKPMDPTRWAPLGTNATYVVKLVDCDECRLAPEECHCMNDLTPRLIREKITAQFGK